VKLATQIFQVKASRNKMSFEPDLKKVSYDAESFISKSHFLQFSTFQKMHFRMRAMQFRK
jgi:hypothetical protein